MLSGAVRPSRTLRCSSSLGPADEGGVGCCASAFFTSRQGVLVRDDTSLCSRGDPHGAALSCHWCGQGSDGRDENSSGSILPLAHFCAAHFRVADQFTAEPLLAKDEHVMVWEHLRDVALEALGREGIPPPEHTPAIFESAATLEECELRRRLHLVEHLTDGELLIQEELLTQRCSDGHGARRDAGGLAAA